MPRGGCLVKNREKIVAKINKNRPAANGYMPVAALAA
ncbi:hypothetical protein HDEF_0701 [Candidatus Hamiltonella defensa 5AT (Acyrthosiphon pisum)]|uniref:Uncharacterized protein n=2 Tax=Hamiltonella defensa subsp. Acyrthosiphon pisum (strain 5AT) TaxID=572265 RepID=C4K4E1_HAMD5|nr:hypothetical protein HDEF_0701 [Candidatus Hamiltonella defensa 5AT (Acyrthosiphon pisum)]